MKTVAESPKARERAAAFTTVSGRPIERLYNAEDVAGLSYVRDINDPGQFPYTRGIHPTGYRGKLWTMRQFAGFGTPAETNERYKTLLADITTSMTINSPAPMLLAMYLVVAERQGATWQTLSGTIQNDILKEFIAQKEFIYPPRPSMRLITDIFEFCTTEVPKWNTISVSGYHIREAGATAAQELAFTLRNGIEYVQYGVDAGLEVDEFAPRISFFFNSHSDFFEELAKFRAARRIWARTMRDRFKAKNPRAWQLRFHT